MQSMHGNNDHKSA